MFIYLIVNHITGKYYVGQHKGADLKKYLRYKFSDARSYKGSSHLFNSMKKHPLPCDWSIHALLSDVQTKAELDRYEKEFIEFLRSRDPEYGYNICLGGEGSAGFKHTEQWKQWMSRNAKTKGIKPTPEATAKSILDRQEIQKQSGIWPGAPFKDMTGTVVNGISILSRLENTQDGDATWSCRCFCGIIFVAAGGDLRNGHTRSCGCLKIEQDRINLGGLKIMTPERKAQISASVKKLWTLERRREQSVVAKKFWTPERRVAQALRCKAQRVTISLHKSATESSTE